MKLRDKILSLFDSDGCLETVQIVEAGIDLGEALDELIVLEREGIVYEEKIMNATLYFNRWVSVREPFSTVRAWHLTELGKIYLYE